MNDREKFLNRVAEGRSQAHQQGAFPWSGLDVFRAPRSENGVLGFQVGDLAQHDGLGHVDQKNEEWVLAGKRHGKMGGKKMAILRIFGYKKLQPQKTEFTEAARERNNFFA